MLVSKSLLLLLLLLSFLAYSDVTTMSRCGRRLQAKTLTTKPPLCHISLYLLYYQAELIRPAVVASASDYCYTFLDSVDCQSATIVHPACLNRSTDLDVI